MDKGIPLGISLGAFGTACKCSFLDGKLEFHYKRGTSQRKGPNSQTKLMFHD